MTKNVEGNTSAFTVLKTENEELKSKNEKVVAAFSKCQIEVADIKVECEDYKNRIKA